MGMAAAEGVLFAWRFNPELPMTVSVGGTKTCALFSVSVCSDEA